MKTRIKIHSANFKAKLLDGAASLFEAWQIKALEGAALTAPLYEEIGRLKAELDWLKKFANPLAVKQSWLECDHEEMSLRPQFGLLGLNKSSVYYQPEAVSPDEIDWWDLHPLSILWLKTDHHTIKRDHDEHWNSKRVQSLLRIMGLRIDASGPQIPASPTLNKIFILIC